MMRLMPAVICAATLVSIAVASATTPQEQDFGPGFVFEVRKDNQITGYLAGSLSLYNENDLPLPTPYDVALTSAGELVFENDLSKANDRDFQREVLRNARLPQGEQLTNKISSETLQLITHRIADSEITLETLQPFKPWLAAMMITGFELVNLGYERDSGVDNILHRIATEAGRQISWLENPTNLVDTFNTLSQQAPDETIRLILARVPKDQEHLTSIVHAWKHGEHKVIEEYFHQQFPADSVFTHKILTERNRSWTPLIIRKMTDAPAGQPPFFIVSVAHLLGTDNLRELIAVQGYTITPLK